MIFEQVHEVQRLSRQRKEGKQSSKLVVQWGSQLELQLGDCTFLPLGSQAGT